MPRRMKTQCREAPEPSRADSPIVGGPDPHSRVERAGDDAFAVERDRVDLGRVTAKDVQALARVDVPQLRKKSVS